MNIALALAEEANEINGVKTLVLLVFALLLIAIALGKKR